MNKIKMMMIIIIIIITKKNLTQKRLIVIHSAELHFLSFFCHCCFLCISFLLLAGIPTSRCFIPLHNFIIFCVPLRFKDIASLKKNQNKKICDTHMYKQRKTNTYFTVLNLINTYTAKLESTSMQLLGNTFFFIFN